MKSSIKTSPMDLSLLNGDERAFIHQQTEKIQEFIDADSQLEMKVDLLEQQNSKNKKRKMYMVTLTLKEGGTQILAKSRQGDFFSALSQASDRLMGALHQIQNEVMTNSERQLEIKNAFDSKYLH